MTDNNRLVMTEYRVCNQNKKGLDNGTMFTAFNPVIFMMHRFIGLSDLRSGDESIKILVDD